MQETEVGDFAGAEKSLMIRLKVQPGDLNARLALAELYVRSGRPEAARQQLLEALRLHPRDAPAEFALGRLNNQAGRPDEAEPLLRDVVRQVPGWAQARLELALSLVKQRKYADAADFFRPAQPPAEPAARIRYFRLAASIHSGLGDSRASAHDMEQALKIAPEDNDLRLATTIAEADAGAWASCLQNSALLYKKRPNPAVGLLLLRAELATHADITPTLQSLRALRLSDDQSLELRTALARVLAEDNLHREAVEDLKRVVALSEGRPELLYDLALEEFRSGQFEDAFTTISRLRELEDTADVEDLAGDIEEQRGNYLAAVQCYQRAVALSPEKEKYRISLGLEFIRHESFEPAVVVFQQAAALFPRSARIQIGLGTALYLLQRYDESVAAFLNAAELDPRSDQPIRYLGMTQTELPVAPASSAVSAVCHRANANQNDAVAMMWCGAMLFRQAYLAGDNSRASEFVPRLQAAAKLLPEDPVATCRLGQALVWLEMWSAARAALETCVRLQPDSEVARFRLLRVYQGLGLSAAAREQMELFNRAKQRSATEAEKRQSSTQTFIYELLDKPSSSQQPR